MGENATYENFKCEQNSIKFYIRSITFYVKLFGACVYNVLYFLDEKFIRGSYPPHHLHLRDVKVVSFSWRYDFQSFKVEMK